MKFRQVHLDFHTSEKIDGIGADFDRVEFQRTLLNAHVDSITLFSKCHHGWSYHPTKANEMHPNLKFDIFGEQIKAAKEIGVNVVGYISAGLDEKYAVAHPECLARHRNEQIIRTADFSTAGYHMLCFNSPYLDVLAEQVKEMCENYSVSGVFLDIVKPTKCYCRNCIALMEKNGLDPDNEQHVAEMALKTYEKYTSAMRAAVDSVDPKLTVFHNGGATPRGKRSIIRMNSHVEIESLPTGGWGYDNLPITARYVQQLGMDFLGMTGKFHLSWGEFGGYKHENALIYETSLAAANGGKCSIGDQLHPSGKMDEKTYRIIGRAYEAIEKKEPWLDGVRSVADIGLLSYDSWLVHRGVTNYSGDINRKISDIGALRILLEGHYLFDVLDCESEFDGYKLIILPDNLKIDNVLKQKLDKYLSRGGKLLASGASGLKVNDSGDTQDFAFDFGVKHCGVQKTEPTFMAVKDKLEGIEEAGYVLYAKTQRVELTSSGEALAEIHQPYFERNAKHFCSHLHAPEMLEYAGVGVSAGRGGIYIANAIFREYADIGSLVAKNTVCSVIDRLLGESKTLSVELPAQGIVTLMEQTAENRSVLHLLYAPKTVKGSQKIEVIEDCIPLYNTKVALNIGKKRVSRVYIAPQLTDIEYSVSDQGKLTFDIPEISIHAMVVIEYEVKELET